MAMWRDSSCLVSQVAADEVSGDQREERGAGLFRENNQAIIAGEVTSLKQTMQWKIVKILIYSNWISSSKCVVSGSKNPLVFWHKGSVSLFENESSQKPLEENCIESDSPVSTKAIQGINNSSAKSTTKSELDKEPPPWPGCDAKSLWNCPFRRSW